jgi:PAS domain S-box-containing protein
MEVTMMDTSKHVKGEAELKRERKFLRNIMATIPNSMLVLDKNLRIKSANRSFCQLFQMEPEKAPGRKLVDILKDEDGKLAAELTRLFGTEDVLENFEFRYQSPKLGERVFNITVRGVIVAEEEEEEEEEEQLVVLEDITQRKRAEEALRESEQNFRNSLEMSPLGIRIVNAKGKLLYANRAILDICGYGSVQELRAVSRKRLYTPQSYAEHQERVRKRKLGEFVPSSYEISIVRKDGEVRHLQVFRAEVIWNGQRQYQALYQDITKLKRAQEALRESEERYRALVELGGDVGEAVVMLQDTEQGEGVQTFVSEQWLQITGYSREELLGKSFFDLVSPSDRQGCLDRHRRKMSGESVPGLYEMTIIRKDGNEVPTELTSAYTTYRGKRANVAYIRDITERKLAEAERKRLVAAIETSREAVCLTSSDGAIIYTNEAMDDLFGYRKEELIGKLPSVLSAGPTPEAVTETIMKAVEKKGHWEGEILNKRKDGSEFISYATISAVRDKDGKIVNFISTQHDITELKQKDESLRQQRDELASRVRIVEKLLSTMELEPRLNAILGEAMGLVPVEMGAIYLVSGDEVLLRSWKGIPDRMWVSMQSFTLTEAPRWLREAVVLHEAVDEPGEIWPSAKEAGIQWQCSVPLVLEKHVSGSPQAVWLGTLVLASRKPTEPERAIATLAHIGKELSLAIDHSLHYQRAIRRLARLNILRQIDAGIMAHLGVDEILRIVLDNVPKELGADAVALSLFTQKELSSRVFVMRLPNGTVIDEEAFSVAEGVLHWLVERKEPVIIYNLSTDPRVQMHSKLIRQHRLSSYLATPLVAENEALGILHILTTKPTVFAPEDVEFFQTLAGQAGIALRSALLFEQMKQSEAKHRMLLETLEEGVATTDSEGRFAYVSPRLLELTGYSEGELLGQHFTKIQAPEYWKEAREEFQRNLGNGLPHIVETEFVRKDGSCFPVELTTKGITTGRLCVARDITERKKAEEEKKELRNRAYLASRLATVGEMAAGIAHEINNPLTAVIGFAELIMERKLPKDTVAEYLKTIHDNGQRVSDIVKRLLTFARQQRPEQTVVNINELIENTLQMRAYEMDTGGIKVTTQLEPELPPTLADAGQLQQVVLNLLVNAEQAMTEAHGKGNLLIKTEGLGKTIRISFKDDGPGISEENMAKIFQPFFSTKKVGQGTGLGLSICYGIISEHDGKIYAESQLGKGANFVVELPVVSEERKVESAELETERGDEMIAAKILVVDDEPSIRTLLKEILTDEGYQVETADNGEAALKLIESEKYNLILLDIKLPDMSGFDLYHQLDRVDKSLRQRIAFITGDVMGTDTRKFLSQSKAPYFTKPFDFSHVNAEIKRLLMHLP